MDVAIVGMAVSRSQRAAPYQVDMLRDLHPSAPAFCRRRNQSPARADAAAARGFHAVTLPLVNSSAFAAKTQASAKPMVKTIRRIQIECSRRSIIRSNQRCRKPAAISQTVEGSPEDGAADHHQRPQHGRRLGATSKQEIATMYAITAAAPQTATAIPRRPAVTQELRRRG